LDTSTINDILGGSAKDEDTSFDFTVNKEVKSLGSTKKAASEIPVGDTGKDWQKLMNLLMQLRKVCNQYDPHK